MENSHTVQIVSGGLTVSGLTPVMTGVEPMVIGNKQSQQISVTGLMSRPVQGVIPATAAEIHPLIPVSSKSIFNHRFMVSPH